uniref:Uncharacterized protein n=1 Tax=Tetranychus urticae TaxID=32264 RepID=T1L5X3_TETUR
MQQVNPEASGLVRSQGILSIVVRILAGYTLVCLIIDIGSMVHGVTIINRNEAELSDSEISFGKIFLITSTIISFFLGFAIIVSIGLKKRYVTIALGLLFMIAVFVSLRFVKFNYSLIGLASNSIITLIAVLIAFFIKTWRRTQYA